MPPGPAARMVDQQDAQVVAREGEAEEAHRRFPGVHIPGMGGEVDDRAGTGLDHEADAAPAEHMADAAVQHQGEARIGQAEGRRLARQPWGAARAGEGGGVPPGAGDGRRQDIGGMRKAEGGVHAASLRPATLVGNRRRGSEPRSRTAWRGPRRRRP